MKIDSDKMLTYSAIKVWLMIVLGGFVFVGAFLCQSRDKISHFNWFQLGYFILAIVLAIYGFCVINMDRHPALFVDIQDPITQEEAENIKCLIDKMSKVSNDQKGNKV